MPQPPSPALRAAVAGETLPALVVDLDAVNANIADLTRRAAGTPIRVASKSLRIPELIAHVLGDAAFSGVLAYTAREAIDLVRWGVTDDAVVAYPTADAAAVAEIAADPQLRAAVTLMADSAAHLEWFDRVVDKHDGPVRICLDADASWKPVPGVHIGAHRSPTHSPRQAADIASRATAIDAVQLVGLMMYEAHIAGVADGGSGPMGAAIRTMQAKSAEELAARRAEVVAAIEKVAGPLEFVNGGGTGSVETTVAEAAVTEVAAGSGIIGPGLFDGYRDFHPHPAEWFVLPVVRRPARTVATVLGGGRIASGPAGDDRLPIPVWPEGLSYIGSEGPGEVQTPLSGSAARPLRIGDGVWFRHAKAGEGAEHANEAIIVTDGGITGRWATYRGKGRSYT